MTPRVASYQQAIDFLFGRVNYERVHDRAYSLNDFKLERMRKFLELLGNPQQRIPVVHIAGTKGKGSTAIMIAEILSAAGYRTGLFTSPHISAFEERMTVGGVRPEPAMLVDLVNRVLDVVNELDETPDLSPTYFEIATALGWLYFVDQKAEIVALEVGMGGRLDSTNICRPVVTVITSISRDHTAFLGNTLAAIAGEKAGIIKPGVPLVSGVLNDEPRDVIRSKAEAMGIPLFELGTDFRFETLRDGQPDQSLLGHSPLTRLSARIQTFTRDSLVLQLPLAGEHQAANLAVAVCAIDLLRNDGWQVSDEDLHAGLLAVRWPARIEVVSVQPTVIVDAAHNLASVQALVKTLNSDLRRTGKRLLIFAGTKDKDVPDLLAALLPEFDVVILTKYTSNPRAMDVEDLVEIAERLGGPTLRVAADPASAWELAKELAGPDDLVCVAGSFFVAAEIREIVIAEKKHLPEKMSPADAT
ncbi:MAG: folylpolyglutamate synthase/dihydrofolate synthase family protein [Planctomycetaceae bacterium]